MGPGVLIVGLLSAAVACEIAGTRCLSQSRQFARLAPLLMLARLYAAAFVLLACGLTDYPLGPLCLLFGVALATLTLIGLLVWRPVFDRAGLAGLLVIGTGVAAVQALPLVALP